MTDDKPIHNFNREINCTYKEEQYSVRNNGAVLKHSHVFKRPRPTDNQWTFGKSNHKTGYMEISSTGFKKWFKFFRRGVLNNLSISTTYSIFYFF